MTEDVQLASKETSLYIDRPTGDPSDWDDAVRMDGTFALDIVAPPAVDLCSSLKMQVIKNDFDFPPSVRFNPFATPSS